MVNTHSWCLCASSNIPSWWGLKYCFYLYFTGGKTMVQRGWVIQGYFTVSINEWINGVQALVCLVSKPSWTETNSHRKQVYGSVQFSRSVVSDSLRPHGLQHTRLPCPSPTLGACSKSCPLSWWCHPTILSSVIPFSFCLQSFPASGSFPVSQFFASGGQSIRVSASASVLPVNIQDWFPLGFSGLISLHQRGKEGGGIN